MKAFLKYDFYFQSTIFIAYIIGWLVIEHYDLIFENYFLLFYHVMGGIQLLSYLIRLGLKYPKNLMYILYGIFIIPVWLIYFYDSQIEKVGEIFFYILFFGFIYSPFLAISYIIYTYIAYKSQK
ncbi:hypothetical protein [Chryseobacterium taiwanense]|uniref:Uncharacterized protein n=1 Tax=Chryseobacterium taiwanense TaxID=363331 RepID=A0A0B4D4Y3_9FLAO|nr:hypothetical protein [Chryseobacterium taiwanense]KIC63732.1 hypothetical protein RM51_08765 [Chryseobacterium taiwanense]